MFPSVDAGPSSPSTSVHSHASPKNTELFRLPSREGFGTSSNRFETQATLTPGVGAYNVVPEYSSAMLIESPSVSRKGYKGSFGSKTPKFPPTLDSGVPGPNAYSLETTSISSTGNMSRATSPSRSAAFTPSGKGRVPFPDPEPNPGPNSYIIKDNPGVSPFLLAKESATFLSNSKRDSFFRVSDTPSPVAYHPQISPGKEHAKGDIQWSKSPYTRFNDLGKDNKVPGPQRYFNEALNAELEAQRQSSLRSCGAYRGPYMGKQSEHGVVLPTFGSDKDRFKHSFCGRLDLIAEIPGPGAYHEDLSVFSTVKLRSYNAQFNPELSARLLTSNHSHSPPHRPTTSNQTSNSRYTAHSNNNNHNGSHSPSQVNLHSRPQTTASMNHHNNNNNQSNGGSTSSNNINGQQQTMTPSSPSGSRSAVHSPAGSPHMHAFGRTHFHPSPPVKHVIHATVKGDYIM